MQLIPVDASRGPSSGHSDAGQRALAGVIAHLGDEHFGSLALARLNDWMPMCWWSVYRIFDSAPPTMHASGSFGVLDGTLDSFHAYREGGLYLRDQTFSAARDALRSESAVLTHWDAREIPPPHRQQIYRRHGLRERLSLVTGDVGSSLLAVNLYRHEHQAAFSAGAIDDVRLVARPLLACVSKHLALVESRPIRANSEAAFGSLKGRELEVVRGLLKGWSHAGIAAELGLSAGTVKTYRDRAFEKLRIHHRNELFALAIGEF